jgi:hypothetical protein
MTDREFKGVSSDRLNYFDGRFFDFGAKPKAALVGTANLGTMTPDQSSPRAPPRSAEEDPWRWRSSCRPADPVVFKMPPEASAPRAMCKDHQTSASGFFAGLGAPHTAEKK